MASDYDFKVGVEYTLSTSTQGPLPLEYKHIKLEAQASYDIISLMFGNAAYTMWRHIYPRLPASVPDDPRQVSWYVFVASNGEKIYLAAPWINAASIKPVKFRQKQFILTDTNETQIKRVHDFLVAIGASFTNSPIE